MNLRRATLADLDQVRELFFDTVTTVNTAHYNPKQVKAWSSGYDNIERWTNRILEHHFFVADINGVIAGFASITADGYLDVLFVHKDFQRRGVALSLLNQIKKVAHTPGINRITSDVSITARPFFEKQGFSIVAAQQVALNGVVFDNFKMEILI